MVWATYSKRAKASVLRLIAFVGLVTGLVLATEVTAGAQDSVDDWVAVTGVQDLPGPGLYTDYSGGVLNPDGTLLVVDNGEDDIIEYTPNGNGGWNIGRIIDLEQSDLSDPVDDLEDITRMGGDRYAIIDENDNTLTVFDLRPGQDEVDEIYTIALWPYVDNFGGNGIEGLFYSFEDSVGDTDTFYVASEVNALIVRLDIVDGELTFRGPDIRLNIPAASAIYRVPNDGTFYIVANRTRSVYRFRSDGVLLGPPRRLDFGNPEGLTFSDDGSRILVIGEARGGGNEIQEFRPPTQRGVTVLSQFSQGNSDGIQRGDGSVDLDGDRLLIGPGPFNESALRIDSLCIPDNAEIRRATLSFVPAASEGATAGLRVVGHRTTHSSALAATQNNFTNRDATATVVSEGRTSFWDGGRPWRQFTPDLADVIDEIRSLPGRSECGPVTLRVSTDGARRSARSANGSLELAPTLVIDWVSAAAPPAVTVNATPSCVGAGGRIDAALNNPTNSPTTVTVSFTGGSDQTISLPARSDRTATWTGLDDGRYLASTVIAGVPTGNDDAVVDCGRQVTWSQRCIRPGNGAVDFEVLNPGEEPAELRVAVGQLPSQSLYLHGWQRGTQNVSGILDGQYAITLLRGNVVEFTDTVTVTCGAPPPPCTYTFANNASFAVLAYSSFAGSTFEIGRVGAFESVDLTMPSGFDPGLGDTFVLYNESFSFLQWYSVDAAGVPAQCDWRLYYPFANPLPPAPPLPPVAVTLACTGRIGEVRLAVVNQTDEFVQYNVDFGTSSRVIALTAGASIGIVFTDVLNGEQHVVISSAEAVLYDESLSVDCGLDAPDPNRPGAQVVHATSCLAGNGRHDITWVNTGLADATYTIDFEGLSLRRVTTKAGDWGRLPFTGRADGTYQVMVQRDGVVVSDHTVVVDCDLADPQLNDPEVQVISSCRNGFGYILFQMVNDSASPAGYIIEFEGVPNRSTTAQAHGAAVRAVTGRATGTYEALVRIGVSPVASLTVDVDCG